jgi:hypothetical protein
MTKIITFGLPCTPAKIIKHEITQNIERVLLSYGGGIGGSTQTLFIKDREDSITGEPFMDVTKINGYPDKLNKNFIVKITPVRLYTVVTDITANRNYHTNVCKSAIHTEVFVLEMDEYPVIETDKYHGDNSDRRIINEVEVK